MPNRLNCVSKICASIIGFIPFMVIAADEKPESFAYRVIFRMKAWAQFKGSVFPRAPCHYYGPEMAQTFEFLTPLVKQCLIHDYQ